MYNTDVVRDRARPAGASCWTRTRRTRARSAPTTAPIYIADAALYLMKHQARPRDHEPVRSSTRPSSTPPSSCSASRTRSIGKYWGTAAEQIDGLRRGRHGRRHDLAVPGQHARRRRRRSRRVLPEGGRDRLVRHLDDLLEGRSTPTACTSGWTTSSRRRRTRRRPCGSARRRSASGVRRGREAQPGHCDAFHAKDEAYFTRSTTGPRRRRTAVDGRGDDLQGLPTTGRRPGRRSRAADRSRPPTTEGSRAHLGGARASRRPAPDSAPMTADRPRRAARRRGAARRAAAPPAPAGAARRCCSRRPLGWLVLAYLGSLAVLLAQRVLVATTRSPATSIAEFTLDNFERSPTTEVYRTIAMRTVGHGALVTVTDAVLAFPIAYYMARVASPRIRGAARRRGAAAAVGELPRQGLRVAHYPAAATAC